MPRQYTISLHEGEGNISETSLLDEDFLKGFAESLLRSFKEGDEVTQVLVIAYSIACRRVKLQDKNFCLDVEEKIFLSKINNTGSVAHSLVKYIDK